MANKIRIDEKTPNGGAYSEIIYLDKDNSIVDEEEASRCVVREYSDKGDLITETWGEAKRRK